MDKTTNYQLSQWEKTDRIQMEDFNGDNAKVESALSALAAAAERMSQRIYTGSFLGTGTTRRSFTFPRKPQLMVVSGQECDDFIIALPVGTRGLAHVPNTNHAVMAWLTCTGTVCAWDNYCNQSGKSYAVFAILEE